jgi:hypothetical protein
MSPAAPGAQLRWNFTASCLPEAWITRTRDLPAGVVSWSSSIFSCAAWPFGLRAAAVDAGKLVPAAPDRLVDYPSLGVQLEHVDALRRVGLD